MKEIGKTLEAANQKMMSGTIPWEDQQAFLAAFEEGSLSGAARRLGLAQPTVRSRIAALEQRLGTVLFTRSANGLAATEHARSLADSARAMDRASELFGRVASAPAGEIAGTVRLSASEVVGIEVLPPILAKLQAAHPGIMIELSLSNATADLIEQEVDIAIRMHPPREGALVAKKIGVIELGLFAHEDYLARKGMPDTPADLAAHDIIGSDREPADMKFTDALLPNIARNCFKMRTDSHPAQIALARAGMGIAVMQRKIGLADRRLKAVLPDLLLPGLDTWIVTHEDLRRLPRVSILFDHLVRELARYSRPVRSGQFDGKPAS